MEIKEFFEPVLNFIRGIQKKDKEPASKQAAKDRLKLVLMQDRASVSPDFFELMKQEIIDVIKKYIEIDEESLEVELARGFESGLEGPALYANIPIKNVKPVAPKSEESAALSEQEADKLADDILNNIEAASAENSEKSSISDDSEKHGMGKENEGSVNNSKEKIEWKTEEKAFEITHETSNEVAKDSVVGLKSVFGPESEELLRRVLKDKSTEESKKNEDTAEAKKVSNDKYGVEPEEKLNESFENLSEDEVEKLTVDKLEDDSKIAQAVKKKATANTKTSEKKSSAKKSTATKTATRKKKTE